MGMNMESVADVQQVIIRTNSKDIVIDEPEVPLSELLKIVPGPDFPTGGIICGRDGIIEGYKSGRGKGTLREELPEAYKNLEQVVGVVHQAGLD